MAWQGVPVLFLDLSLRKATGQHSKAHLQQERFLVRWEVHDREIQLRIDTSDFQPQCGWVWQAFNVPAQDN